MPDKSYGPLPDIRKVVILNAPIGKVWKGVASSEGLADWYLPNDFKPVLGQEFTFDAGKYGITRCKVTQFGQPHTVIREIMDRGWGDLQKLRRYVEV